MTSTDLVRQLIHSVTDPDGGEALLALHAAQALVPTADGLSAVAAVSAEEFGRVHRQVSLAGADVLPRWSDPVRLERVSTQDVLWFEVRELTQERTLVGALGVHAGAGGPRIGWCTLAARVQTWTYEQGLLQSLSDFPWLKKGGPAPARLLLDASYFRLHWREPVRFTTLPDARFTCQMSAVCCKHDFEIALPKDAQHIVDAMPWRSLNPALEGTRLPVRADGKLLLKSIDETCRFLGAQRQCLIHQTLGRQPFGACSVFPYSFAKTPDGVAVALSPICGSVRQGLGAAPADREDDLRERLVHAEPRSTDHYRLTPEVEVRWEGFSQVENALRECLAAQDLPLRRRLLVGARVLGAIRRGEPLDTQQMIDAPPAQITPDLRQVLRDMLAKILRWDRAALRTLPQEVPADLFARESRDPQVLARILQNVLFSKVYSYSFDLTTAHNLSIILYLLALVMEATCDGPMPDVLWQELGSLGVHGLLKSVLHDGVPAGFRTLVGTAEFGEWALSA